MTTRALRAETYRLRFLARRGCRRVAFACELGIMSQMCGLPRSVWSEPRAPYPLGPGKRDWVLLGVVVASALFEVAARPELSWTSASFICGLALMPTVLWRRSKPLLMVALGFGATTAMALARGDEASDTYAWTPTPEATRPLTPTPRTTPLTPAAGGHPSRGVPDASFSPRPEGRGGI